MLIVCWNVAGLSTTVNRINDVYGKDDDGNGDGMCNSGGTKKKKASPSQVLAKYMKKHGGDIFCIQEHKIPLKQLSSRSEPLGCSNIDGYESYWSCCTDQTKRGLNGVVTYAKCGMVLSANSRPLQSPDLDDQGRCVMTDHGRFVLFNVYVPASCGQPLSYKMKFLNALRRAMSEQRKKNKHVILVGDLNISHTKLDKFWSDRVIFVNDIRREVSTSNNKLNLPRWKLELEKYWPKIQSVLETTKKVISTQTTNSLTNQKYDKFRLAVTVDGKQIFLGSHESEPSMCQHLYDFSSWRYICADTDEELVAEEDNVVRVSILAELMCKIAGIATWNDIQTQRTVAEMSGQISRCSPPRRWLNDVLEKDGMVDVFRHFYPHAQGRYTCWHQFTNKRYTNEGARIDFTLVDRSLLSYVRKGNVPSLRCCSDTSQETCGKDVINNDTKNPYSSSSSSSTTTTTMKDDPNSEEAALKVATANGSYEPVSFHGGGIIEANRTTLDTQFGIPHSGIIYTPPSFSDHVAISLLLDDDICASNNHDDDTTTTSSHDNAETKKAQPHKSQTTIASFFTTTSSTSQRNIKQQQPPSNSNGTAVPAMSKCTNNNVITTKKRKNIEHFFQKQQQQQQRRLQRTASAPSSSGNTLSTASKSDSVKRQGDDRKEPSTEQPVNLKRQKPLKRKSYSILNHFTPKK